MAVEVTENNLDSSIPGWYESPVLYPAVDIKSSFEEDALARMQIFNAFRRFMRFKCVALPQNALKRIDSKFSNFKVDASKRNALLKISENH